MLYGNGTLTNSCREHMLLLLIASLLSHGVGMLFMAGTSLIIYYASSLGLLLIVCLTGMLFFFAGIVYKRAISSISTCSLQRRLLL